MLKLAGAQTEEEFYQTIQQLLDNKTSYSKQGSSKPEDSLPEDSSSSSSSEPIIDLGDDYFGNSGF